MNKDKSRGLLYPAMHKFYSAMSSLEQFEKGKNLFDNISHLDNFFSEYRNITFVLQKSLAHTDFMRTYEKNRDKHLINNVGSWFNNTRNVVLKEHPFDLEKNITIAIYSPICSSVEIKKNFTLENDVEYSSLIESLRSFLIEYNPIEVLFSVKFEFYEKGKDKNLYKDLITGIKNMRRFLQVMKREINENCKLCDELQERIDKVKFSQIPENMLFIDDYVYYVKDNNFEKAERIEPLISFVRKDNNQPVVQLSNKLKFPLRSFIKNYNKIGIKGKNALDVFIYLHLTIFKMQKRIMPAFMIVYKDGTCELTTFDASIKTTLYRKINEIADRIEQDKIKSVFLVNEMIHYSTDKKDYKKIISSNSKERLEYKTFESLGFFMADENLSYHTYFFATDKIKDEHYINSVLNIPDKNISLSSFYHPIINKFERLKSDK